MSLLGFGSSFTFHGCEIVSPVEYGTPHATFKVTGSVTNSKNTEIKNIQVSMMYDTTYTGEDGKYMVEANDFPTTDTFRIHFYDADGDKNGNYQNLDTLISFKDLSFQNGDGSWYEGEKTKELNIKLKEKK
jgi:putative lipoprotein (rSAM/lipoprotein system)